MKYLLTILSVLLGLTIYAQGDVRMTTSSTVDHMMAKFITVNKSQETIKGWRIQIITTDDRRKMESAITKFKKLHPDVDLEWNHTVPYYRVKVGAYENKLQLMGFLIELKSDFPGVIPVQDDINKSDFVIH